MVCHKHLSPPVALTVPYQQSVICFRNSKASAVNDGTCVESQLLGWLRQKDLEPRCFRPAWAIDQDLSQKKKIINLGDG
jgi:hypothetical protein